MSEVTSVPKHNQRIHPENWTHLAILLLKQLCYLAGIVLFMSLHRSYQVHLWVSAHVPKMLLLGCLFTRILCTGCYTPLFYSTWTPNTLFCIHPFTQAHMCFQTLSHIYTTMDASHSNSPPTLGMQTCSTSWATATPLAALQQKTAQKLTKISAQGIACLLPPICSTMNMVSLNVFNPAV